MGPRTREPSAAEDTSQRHQCEAGPSTCPRRLPPPAITSEPQDCHLAVLTGDVVDDSVMTDTVTSLGQ